MYVVLNEHLLKRAMSMGDLISRTPNEHTFEFPEVGSDTRVCILHQFINVKSIYCMEEYILNRAFSFYPCSITSKDSTPGSNDVV